jgi:prefoldin subunit 5
MYFGLITFKTMDKEQFEKRVSGLKEKLGKLKGAVKDLKQSIDNQEVSVNKLVEQAQKNQNKEIQS